MMKPGILALAAAFAFAAPAAAQHADHADHADHHDGSPTVMTALINDIGEVEQKMIGLAEAVPEDRWGWRPAEGVRSIGEVFMHVAADNYFLPAMTGVAAPEETGVRGDSYQTAVAYESRRMTKAQTIAAMRASFAHLREAMGAVDQHALMSNFNFFGNQMSGLQVWVLTATHLHEHLGQSIAYARSNGITPPWSRN